MNEIIEGQQIKDKEKDLSCSQASDSGSIHTGSLATSSGESLSGEQSKVSFRSPSPFQARDKDMGIQPTAPDEEAATRRQRTGDSNSNCSGANTIPFSTHSGVHSDSDENDDVIPIHQ